MKRLFILTLIASGFFFLGLSAEFKPILPTITIDNTRAAENVWAQMREGTGYVVLLRHAQTEPGTGDPPGFELNDCTTQRNLSEAGREQATQIGRVFRDRNISIAGVLSSQYCRCLDTARLLDLGTVKSAPMLNSIFEDRTTATQQLKSTRHRILDHRTSGVIVMVSHYANISELSGVYPQEGEAVVIRADRQGDLKVVSLIDF